MKNHGITRVRPLLGGAGASLAKQALAAGATLVYGGLMTAAILWLLRGIARLRVVDSSIMPTVVRRCPAATAIMIGERAAAFFA